ncbi:hypothetical protein [Trichormus azollae]|nr:hypothetical protein [Trichormus azollae]
MFPSKFGDLENVEPNLYEGSFLEILPTFPGDSVDFVITSPPYLN